jgi:hypothetical protein
VAEETQQTVGQIARLYNEPAWKIRRIVDSLNPALPRVGMYRLVPSDLLPAIRARLDRRQLAGEPHP